MRVPGWSCALGLVISLWAAPSTSAAEPRPSGVDVQQFRSGPGGSDYLDVLGGFMGRHLGFTVGGVFNWTEGTLLSRRDGRGEKVNLLDGQGTFELLTSIGFWERLEIGVVLPVVGMQTLGPAFAETPGLVAPSEGVRIGDVRIVPKARLFGIGRSVAVSIAAPMSLPTGSDFAGYGAFTIEPTLIGDFVPAPYFRMTLNVGGRLRPDRSFADLDLGNEVTWGLGMKFSFLVGDQPFSVIGAFGGAFELPNQESEVPPFGFTAGLEWRGIPNVAVTAGAGSGITRGYGSPDTRIFASVRYTPFRECVYGPEDYDGFEDDDGCNDPDNDGDGIPDELDLCPNEPETFNGWEDEDGCPDEPPDFTLLDPANLEDAFSSTTADFDGDGIPDAYDACPTEPEDFDGFLDGDGCPDPDNDGDGIPDELDLCPDVAEIFNDFEDDDGCPDEVPPRLAQVDELGQRIEIADNVYFDTGRATIQSRSFALLDEIARILRDRPDITRVRVEGHTDSVGSADLNRRLSQRRADAVREALIERGVEPGRLESLGFGQTAPVADNRTEEGRARNRRVELNILELRRAPP